MTQKSSIIPTATGGMKNGLIYYLLENCESFLLIIQLKKSSTITDNNTNNGNSAINFLDLMVPRKTGDNVRK